MHEFDANILPSIRLAHAQQASADTDYIQPFAGDFGADRYAWLLQATAVGTTLDMKLVQATSSGGAGEKDVVDVDGNAVKITQLVAADDQVLVAIDIGPGMLDDKNGFTWVKAVCVAAGTCTFGVIGFAHKLRNKRADGSLHDASYLFAKSARVYSKGQD